MARTVKRKYMKRRVTRKRGGLLTARPRIGPPPPKKVTNSNSRVRIISNNNGNPPTTNGNTPKNGVRVMPTLTNITEARAKLKPPK